MKTNFLLYGPPGIGKSTTIKKLKELGVSAFDLEDLKTSAERPSAVKNMINTGTFIGAADVDPDAVFENTKKILLTLPQDKYDLRREERDSKYQYKKNQAYFKVEEFTNGHTYDYYFEADDKLIDNLLRLIKK